MGHTPRDAVHDFMYTVCQSCHWCLRMATAEGPIPANRAGFRCGYNTVVGGSLGKSYSGGFVLSAVALQGAGAPN